MIVNWAQIRAAETGPWVGVSHPDGRRVLTNDLGDPVVGVMRRINKRKADGSRADPVKAAKAARDQEADYALVAQWLDREGVL